MCVNYAPVATRRTKGLETRRGKLNTIVCTHTHHTLRSSSTPAMRICGVTNLLFSFFLFLFSLFVSSMGASNLTLSKDQHQSSSGKKENSFRLRPRNELSIRCACSFDFKRRAWFLCAHTRPANGETSPWKIRLLIATATDKRELKIWKSKDKSQLCQIKQDESRKHGFRTLLYLLMVSHVKELKKGKIIITI